jgi:hypothetical protein
VNACKTNHHFLNYWSQDGALKKVTVRQRTELEQIRYYVATRYQSFFSVLVHDDEMKDQHINPSHFVTESLLKLWELVWNGGNTAQRNPALKSIYTR